MSQKEIHLHLNPEMMTYQIQAEYDLASTGDEEEDARMRTLAYKQVEAAMESYREEGWVLDGPYQQSVSLERRIIGKEGGFLRGHIHLAAIVGAKVRMRKDHK